jgi:hypothetical protein
MIDQKNDKLLSTQKWRWRFYDYMVCCITLGLSFSCIQNSSNQTLVIKLTPRNVLYLDFSFWNQDLERAVLYDDNVLLHMNLAKTQEMILKEGERNAVVISQEKKEWIKFCYKNRLSFDCLDNELIISAENTCTVAQLQVVLRFSKNGIVADVKCTLQGEANHYRAGIKTFILRCLKKWILIIQIQTNLI